MDDPRAIQLLQEIRDIHREHLESYQRGLQNQEESIRMQREMQDDYRRRMRCSSSWPWWCSSPACCWCG